MRHLQQQTQWAGDAHCPLMLDDDFNSEPVKTHLFRPEQRHVSNKQEVYSVFITAVNVRVLAGLGDL